MGRRESQLVANAPRSRTSFIWTLLLFICMLAFAGVYRHASWISPFLLAQSHRPSTAAQLTSPYGQFPVPNDPFQFVPCTSWSILPPLDDQTPEKTWAKLFDPNPEHWSWGAPPASKEEQDHHNPYSGRGIYLCGYIDVPLDYTNNSDSRITRLAVTKFQVSGLALSDSASCSSSEGKKSERTIVIEPGGPGGSGTSYAWRAAEDVTKRLSGGKFDVLGWDPRGVNASLPAVSCFPFDADRDRWSLLAVQAREVSPSPMAQLEFVDALWDSTYRSCWERQGDLGRFLTTASVARDLEEIRKTLGEDDLTGYLVSYGTGIGQTYANMFPDSVGRMILDGTEYVRDHRLLGGFGWTALDNGTDAWHDGFLGECLNAGPEHCALAKPKTSESVTLPGLVKRMEKLVKSFIHRPIPGYSSSSGPSLITYSRLVDSLYSSMYNAYSWPALAEMLSELEDGNSTLATAFIDHWEYDPTLPCQIASKPSSDELAFMVICGDSYDAPQPDGLEWWANLWEEMTTKSWIASNLRFYSVFPCRHYSDYWTPAEVYRGDLNHTLKNPILLIAEIYDPATPLRNGRRLLNEMGQNARLIAHHGYGHSSRDTSNCTDSIAKEFILTGKLPDEPETACYANEKPYLYGKDKAKIASSESWDPVSDWRKHLEEMKLLGRH